MQVENSEINGFLIDQFNQYGLAEGKTQRDLSFVFF